MPSAAAPSARARRSPPGAGHGARSPWPAPRWAGPLAGLVAGALVALSLPPFGWWPLAWIGLAILAWVLPGRRWKGRLAVGAAFGAADYLIGLLWVQEFSLFGYVGVVLISALYAAVALAMVPSGRRRYVAVGLPATLILADWARDRFPLGGLPLAGTALGQATGPLVPVVRLGGSLALTGATALVGVALAESGRWLAGSGWLAGARRVVGGGGRGAGATVRVAGLVAAAAVLPVAGLLSPSGQGGHRAPIRVGLVQGGGPRGTRAVYTDPQVVFNRHLAASASLVGPLDLIVWPEGVLQSHNPFTAGTDARAVADMAVEYHATALVGVEQDVGVSHYLNEVVAWSPEGRVVGRYVKNHLVPFGEYVPYRSLVEKLFNVSEVPYDGIPGHGPGFLRTPAGSLAVMISYEVFFDERARGGVRSGGGILVVPTNTASYRSTQVPTQEVAADRLRAWETGRWLVQVTPTGYTTVVDPTGDVVRRSHLDSRVVVQYAVPVRTGMTVYDDIGDAPVALLAVAAWMVVGAFARRRRRGWPQGAP